MNHRIFERKLRSLDIQGACLSERRLTIYTQFSVERSIMHLCVSFYGFEPCGTSLRTAWKAQLASVLLLQSRTVYATCSTSTSVEKSYF